MPWGRYKGVRLRLIPTDYLSWLTTSRLMTDARWGWLKESLIAELKYRGLEAQFAATPDPPPVEYEIPDRPIRKIRNE
jgi:uncharacterized protein (DUF3820 family)